MVGVGGRSKACENCRRRRLKCDLVAPQCRRCIKARLDCGGCRDMTVILYDGGKTRVAQQHAAQKSQSSSSQIVGPQESASVLHDQNSQLPKLHDGWRFSLPHDMIFTTYTMSNLLRGTDESAVTPPGGDKVLKEKCFVALSTVYFGIEHREDSITRHGFQRYGHALAELNHALGDPTLRKSLDTFEAVGVMTLIELLMSDSKDGWVSHSRGLEQLLKIRGPESMASLPCLRALETSRPTMIFSSLALHQDTIFSQPEWKELPWRLHPELQNSMKFLIDIMADYPRLFVQRDTIDLEISENSRNVAHKALSHQARRTLADLECWKEKFLFAPATQCTEIPAPLTTPNIIDSDGRFRPAWSTVLQFNSLPDANVVTLYNSLLIMILLFIQRVEVGGRDFVVMAERLHTSGMAICRSVDYHIEATRDSIGSFVLLFPLKMAYEAVGQADPVIGTWLKDILTKISSGLAGRWAAARYLLDINSSPGRFR